MFETTEIPLIATPISHLFDDIHVAHQIIEFSDCLEVRERSVSSKFPNQYLFHIDVDIQHKWDDNMRKYLRSIILSKPNLKLVSLQVTRRCHGEKIVEIHEPNYYKIFKMVGRVYNENEMLNEARKNIKWIRSIIQKDVEIAIENNNYLPAESYDIVTDGKFLSKIVFDNKINFLFDLAHAQVSAKNKNIYEDEYINSLPMRNLIQIHICKPIIPDNGVAYDAHEAPNQKMFEDVVKIIKNFPTVKFLTIEYYKDHEILIKSLRSLKHILNSKLLINSLNG